MADHWQIMADLDDELYGIDVLSEACVFFFFGLFSPLLGTSWVMTSTPCTLVISIGMLFTLRSKSATDSVGRLALASAESSLACASFSSFVDSITSTRS